MKELGMAIGTAAGSIFGSLMGNKMQQDQFGNQLAFYRDWETDRKSTRLNSSHITRSRMPSSA